MSSAQALKRKTPGADSVLRFLYKLRNEKRLVWLHDKKIGALCGKYSNCTKGKAKHERNSLQTYNHFMRDDRFRRKNVGDKHST